MKRIDKFLSGTAGGSFEEPMQIRNPLLIMFQTPPDDSVTCHIHSPKGFDHKQYGLLICDLVRHVARAFKVDEEEVWEWVDMERERPTTELTSPS